MRAYKIDPSKLAAGVIRGEPQIGGRVLELAEVEG